MKEQRYYVVFDEDNYFICNELELKFLKLANRWRAYTVEFQSKDLEECKSIAEMLNQKLK